MVQKKQSSLGVAAVAVAGLAAVSTAAYLFFGPEAKKNKKLVRTWAMKMKAEIIEKLEQTKEVTEPVYHKIVDQAVAKYSKAKNVDQKELEAVVKDLRKHWKVLAQNGKSAKKSPKRK